MLSSAQAGGGIRGCDYGQVMGKLVDGLYHWRRGAQLLEGHWDPVGWVDAAGAADRNFLSHALATKVLATGERVLWRALASFALCPITVRVIEYTVRTTPDGCPRLWCAWTPFPWWPGPPPHWTRYGVAWGTNRVATAKPTKPQRSRTVNTAWETRCPRPRTPTCPPLPGRS